MDLVRDNTKEAAKDTAVKADIERKKSDKEIRNEENVEDDKEEVTYPEFITDDEEAEDDGSIYMTLADKKQIDEVVNEALRMRKERIEKQIEGWNNPEGGMKRGNLKELLLDQQITAEVMKEACQKAKLNPDEEQAKTLKNLIRKRTRQDLGNSPPLKIRPQKKKQRSEDFKTPVLTPKSQTQPSKPQLPTPKSTKANRKSEDQKIRRSRSRSKTKVASSQ